jgi:magnesium chelatase subunit D
VKPAAYPFSAIVGQEQMKLALLLASTDWHLGVLLRGDKGAGKTTAARGLAMLLPEKAPFVNLPIGVTEDRLLGGLHLESTLKGKPLLKPGLLSEAHGGVLYIDEVNLLPAHLGDALLDAAATGINVVEREGFSVSHPAEFVLLGSMNPEEGLLRPQLLDRFALAVDINAPLELEQRQKIVERQIAFERAPDEFAEEMAGEDSILREKIRTAQQRVDSIQCSSDMLAQISAAICSAGVRSLRADLAAVRASIACAALSGDDSVKSEHVDAVMPLVLCHRARAAGRSQPPPPAPAPHKEQHDSPSNENAKGITERIFKPLEVRSPKLDASAGSFSRQGGAQPALAEHPGPVVRTRSNESPREIDLRATLNHAVLETGKLQPRPQDLHEKVRAPNVAVRYLFLIDSSGSHAAHQKMRLVKGAVLGLLRRSFRKGDETVLIAFRGNEAVVLLEPSHQLEDAATALEYLPTGGRTPLAHALELAKNYVTPSTVLILLTDGRANVPVSGGDPWAEALQRAAQVNCRALVVDTEHPDSPVRRVSEIARALRATSIELSRLEEIEHLTAVPE